MSDAVGQARRDLPGNAAQRDAWNDIMGPRWLTNEALLEASLAPVADLLLAEAAPRPGEAVLELGCGAGTLLARFQDAVAPGGTVTGVDISATMLAAARARAPAGVRLLEADAATDALGGPYDLIASRFGVMFFADPVAAFSAVRTALRGGGRLCFAAWGPLADNPQWARPLAIVRRHVGGGPVDPDAPGPLALADTGKIHRILAGAGFARVALRTVRFAFNPGDAAAAARLAVTMGPAGARLREAEASRETIEAVRAEIAREQAATHGTIHLVTARD